MSRLKKFSRNLATSYLQLGVNVIYSLVSIPLILHWLPKAEFGMWAVLVQLMSYVSIIDLGMTSAVARLLVDHKDERCNGNYGAMVKTAFLVSLIQGLIILTVVVLMAPSVTELMKIPVEHQATFITLLRVQGLITAFTFSLRPLGLMLDAHQRMDIMNAFSSYNLVAQLGLLVLFLNQGLGIYSFLYASAITAAVSPAYLVWHCQRLKVLPQAGEWGRLSRQKFREVFSFGMDVFLFGLGGQLIMSSQTIIVSRYLGLDLAAAWAVGTKVFNLCMPLVLRPLFMSMPVLAEMVVRQERERLRSRFKDLMILSGSLGVYLGISYALCNSLFVGIWTHGRITWWCGNDVLLAAWLVLLSLQTVHCNFTLVVKQIGGMRYILFLEGCCFVLLAGLLAPVWGVPGLVVCSIACTAVFSFQYGLRRSQAFFQCGFWEILVQWARPCWNLAAIYGLLAIFLWMAGAGLVPWVRLWINSFMALIIGGLLFLLLGCPRKMIFEILQRLPPSLNRWVRPLFLLNPMKKAGETGSIT